MAQPIGQGDVKGGEMDISISSVGTIGESLQIGKPPENNTVYPPLPLNKYTSKYNKEPKNSQQSRQKQKLHDKTGSKLMMSQTSQISESQDYDSEAAVAARDCLAIKYYRSQVYDPTGSFFAREKPGRVEHEAEIINQAREKNPYLQSVNEIDRLLKLTEKYQYQYEQNLELRKTIAANATRDLYTQRMKRTHEGDMWQKLDDDKQGRDFKREYLQLSDQLLLSGAHKPQHIPNKLRRECISSTSRGTSIGHFPAEHKPLQKLPPVFKSKEAMYEAISAAATTVGIKLRLQQLKKRRENKQMQFMTEVPQQQQQNILTQYDDAPEVSTEEQYNQNVLDNEEIKNFDQTLENNDVEQIQ